MLSKSRFLGLHLRVDKGCLLGKQGTTLGQDLQGEHWGIKVVVKLMCGCTCMCAIYVCMCSCVYACVQRPDVYMTCLPQSLFTLFFEKRPFIGLEFTCWVVWLASNLYGPS